MRLCITKPITSRSWNQNQSWFDNTCFVPATCIVVASNFYWITNWVDRAGGRGRLAAWSWSVSFVIGHTPTLIISDHAPWVAWDDEEFATPHAKLDCSLPPKSPSYPIPDCPLLTWKNGRRQDQSSNWTSQFRVQRHITTRQLPPAERHNRIHLHGRWSFEACHLPF